jgi:hypothetical protein
MYEDEEEYSKIKFIAHILDNAVLQVINYLKYKKM